MAKRPPSPIASWRRRVLAAVAGGWILIVVAGAGAPADDALLGVDNLNIVWMILFGTVIILSIAFFIYLNPFSGEWVEPEKSKRGLRQWLIIAAFFAALVWFASLNDGLFSDEDDEDALSDLFDLEVDTTPDEPAPEIVAQATDILLILVGVALLGGIWYFLRWRSRAGVDSDEEPSNLELEADLIQALEQASHELVFGGDPRTSVLRSYAVLETVLATHGSSRSKAETPTEHLRRSLRNLRIDSTPLIELGQLYELARFSDRQISADQQAVAAQALDRARVSLAALT